MIGEETDMMIEEVTGTMTDEEIGTMIDVGTTDPIVIEETGTVIESREGGIGVVIVDTMVDAIVGLLMLMPGHP